MSRLLAPFDTLYEITGLLGAVVTILLALLLGGPPQRACGWILFLDAIVMTLLQAIWDQGDRHDMVLAKSALLVAAYGAATLRWPDRWLILLTGLQTFCLILHLSTLAEPGLLTRSNGLLLNGAGWLQLIVLSAASIGAAIQRHDRRTPPA